MSQRRAPFRDHSAPTGHHALTRATVAFARSRARVQLHEMLSAVERRRLNALLRALNAVDKRITDLWYSLAKPTQADDARRHSIRAEINELRRQSDALEDEAKALLGPYLPPGMLEEEAELSLRAQRKRYDFDRLWNHSL